MFGFPKLINNTCRNHCLWLLTGFKTVAKQHNPIFPPGGQTSVCYPLGTNGDFIITN